MFDLSVSRKKGLGALLAAGSAGVLLWGAVSPAKAWTAVGLRRSLVTGIVLHHTALPQRPFGDRRDLMLIEAVHQKRGFTVFCGGWFYSVGYHYLVTTTGEVLRGRPEACPGAHADIEGANVTMLGIALVGTFDRFENRNGRYGPEAPTTEQLESALHLVGGLMKKYRLSPAQVNGHRELDDVTTCPGALTISTFRTALSEARTTVGPQLSASFSKGQ